MKSRTALLDRKPLMSARPDERTRSLIALNSVPMGPDCDEDCPFCHGPETD